MCGYAEQFNPGLSRKYFFNWQTIIRVKVIEFESTAAVDVMELTLILNLKIPLYYSNTADSGERGEKRRERKEGR